MNRIQPPLGNQDYVSASHPSCSKHATNGQNIWKPQISFGQLNTCAEPAPRAVFSPLHYEPGYAYPLVVWLHGPGENEFQLRQIMPQMSLRNYVAIAPRGTRALGSSGKRGFTWEQTEQPIDEAAEKVIACLDFASDRFHIASSRLFLAGDNSGGTMAIRLAFRFPELFAGVVSFSGPFPQGLHPLCHIDALRRLPLLLAMGRKGRNYTETRLCQDLRLAHVAGLNVSVRQYPCGDELTEGMLSDTNRWMMDLVCGAAMESI